MNVLSLFDGISCGQIALNRAGIKYDQYFASEIDKHAIKVTQHNYPNTIQLGDVTQVKGHDLPVIDIILGGFCCQSFSFAGKQLSFDDPRGKLFFECVRLMKETHPKYFLFENVRMKQSSEDVISALLGVTPLKLNSSLLCAASRPRLYWTNISNITMPLDKKLVSQDIIVGSYLTRSEINELGDLRSVLDFRNFKTENSKRRIISNVRGIDEKANCLTASNTSNPAGCGCSNYLFKTEKGYDWRKINREECEKAQTLNVGYTSALKDCAAKKAIGNGWTVDVITHILSFI